MNTTMENERPIAELFKDLARETTTLVRQEVGLAKIELSEKAANVGKKVGLISIGGALLHASVLAFMVALVGVFHLFLPFWASALLVSGITAAIGYSVLQKGLHELQSPTAPLHLTTKVKGELVS